MVTDTFPHICLSPNSRLNHPRSIYWYDRLSEGLFGRCINDGDSSLFIFVVLLCRKHITLHRQLLSRFLFTCAL